MIDLKGSTGRAMSNIQPLNREQKIVLLQVARQAIFNSIHRGRELQPETDDSRLEEKQGVFITLTTRGTDRGCVGTFDGDGPLINTLVDLSIRAASEESGFPRLAVQDLPHTDIELSVVSPLKGAYPEQVELGVHGLFIVRGRSRGVLLPQVATQMEWDREQFLRQTCVKAGLPEDAYQDDDCFVYVFTAEVFSESQIRAGE
ncbi:MAG: AmmeMemoRadiSam system protein A [Myxococcota bacterium]|nr:AmmeMemoRadiSam system protein A [Myxococcota bacterium]